MAISSLIDHSDGPKVHDKNWEREREPLIEADAAGETQATLTSVYTTIDEIAERVRNEVFMPVGQRWRKDASGNVVSTVHYGNRRVEIKLSKTVIENARQISSLQR